MNRAIITDRALQAIGGTRERATVHGGATAVSIGAAEGHHAAPVLLKGTGSTDNIVVGSVCTLVKAHGAVVRNRTL